MPPVAVIEACLFASFRQFRTAWQIRRAIPDKSGGLVCALFTYAWGTWKIGIASIILLFICTFLQGMQSPRQKEPSPAAVTAMLLWLGSFPTSALLTASGLVKAFRSGMRVWVGEGVNQANTLLLGMLITGFVVFVVLPSCFWATDLRFKGSPLSRLALFAVFIMIPGASVLLLRSLEFFERHIVADRPGKFGPKVPTVGKREHWEGTEHL